MILSFKILFIFSTNKKIPFRKYFGTGFFIQVNSVYSKSNNSMSKTKTELAGIIAPAPLSP